MTDRCLIESENHQAQRRSSTWDFERRPVARRSTWESLSNGCFEDFLGKLRDSRERRRATGQNHARRDSIDQIRSNQLLAGQAEDLLDPRFDDLAQRIFREISRGFRPPTDGTLMMSSEPRYRADATPNFFLIRSASSNGVRSPTAMSFDEVIATEAEDRGVLDRAVGEDGDVRRAAADIDHAHAEIALVIGRVQLPPMPVAPVRCPRRSAPPCCNT